MVDPAPGSSPASSPVLREEGHRARSLAERADTLRVHVDADPRHLNPMIEPTVWTDRIALGTLFETLVGCAGGADGTSYRPALARSWSIEQGGRVLALELRADVRFHDGSRMTAVDAQFSLDAAREGRASADHLRPLLADVSSVELAGPRGLRIWLHRPSGHVLRALCSVPILPAAVYQGKLRAARDAPVVGSGPYRLDAWEGPVVRLVRHVGYWGKVPSIERLAFTIEPDDARALTLARSGELDVVPQLLPVHLTVADEPTVARRFASFELAPPSFEYLALALDRPPLDDLRVRRAISLAVDRSGLASGQTRPVIAPVWPGGPASGAEPAVPDRDPAAAARLLSEAGWIDRDGDGIRERGAQRLQLVVLVGDQPSEVRERVVKALRQLGFFLDERAGSPAVLLNRLRSGQFQLAFLSWRGLADGDLSPLLASGGKQNFSRASDREIDDLLDAMRATWDPAERATLAGKLGQRFAEVLPFVPLTAAAPRGLVHRRVRGARVWAGWLVLPELTLARDVD